MKRILYTLLLSCAVQAADIVLGVHNGTPNYVKSAYAGANDRVLLFGTWDLLVTTPVANTIMTLRVTAATNLYVLWGDGNETNYTGTMTLSNTYAVAGSYNVSLNGGLALLRIGGTAVAKTNLISVLTKVQGLTFTSMNGMFTDCNRLISIPTNMLESAVEVRDMNAAWYGCNKLVTPPDVNNLTACTNLSGAWGYCGLVSSFPAVNNLTNVKGNLNSTWGFCGSASTFPDVSNLTQVTSLDRTWTRSGAITYPYINTLTNVTVLTRTYEVTVLSSTKWFPDVYNLTKVQLLDYTWNFQGATGFPTVNTMTNVTTLAGT